MPSPWIRIFAHHGWKEQTRRASNHMTLVAKANGTTERVSFDKILKRITDQSTDLSPVDPIHVSKRVIQGVVDGVTTRALDELAADTAASLSSQHPNYAILAARIAITRLHKDTRASIASVFHAMDPGVASFADAHRAEIDAAFVWSTISATTISYKTLERSYLLRDAAGQPLSALRS